MLNFHVMIVVVSTNDVYLALKILGVSLSDSDYKIAVDIRSHITLKV